jgi:hypothetical protein
LISPFLESRGSGSIAYIAQCAHGQLFADQRT